MPVSAVGFGALREPECCCAAMSSVEEYGLDNRSDGDSRRECLEMILLKDCMLVKGDSR